MIAAETFRVIGEKRATEILNVGYYPLDPIDDIEEWEDIYSDAKMEFAKIQGELSGTQTLYQHETGEKEYLLHLTELTERYYTFEAYIRALEQERPA